MLRVLAENWWAVALRGVCGILFGVLAFAAPAGTITALILLFGAYALVDGGLNLVAAFRGARAHERWWPLALEGGLGVAAGLLVLWRPATSALALVYWVAAWALVTGVLEVVAAVTLRRQITGEWLLGASGIASIAFGGLAFVAPDAGARAIVFLFGAYAFAFGILLVPLGVRLRRFQQSHGPVPGHGPFRAPRRAGVEAHVDVNLNV
jgi:uncharacterized membrane protein HdeD (DUF308 family)